jgi:simple sugar transport system ATP-binding protein
VIRRGTTVATVRRGTTPRQLAQLMVAASCRCRRPAVHGDDEVELRAGRVRWRRRAGRRCCGHRRHGAQGEVAGFAGVEGNGQTELVETDHRPAPPATGDGCLGAEDITAWPVMRAARPGSPTSPRTGTGRACCSPARSGRTGCSATRPRAAVQVGWIRRRARAPGHRRGSWRRTTSAPRAPTTLAARLSGGNQQKLIVGREMEAEPRVLIAAHPTRGVDVGAQAAIWDRIRQARATGSRPC